MDEQNLGDDAAPAQAAINGGSTDIDDTLIVNGDVAVKKTHPNLYRSVLSFAILRIALGLNFLILQPTFPIFNAPNELWGVIFVASGVLQVVFLAFRRRLRGVRAMMAFSVGYMLFIALGTCQPYLEYRFGGGKPASLQLPILYLFCAITQAVLLVEPFINPWTAKRDHS